ILCVDIDLAALPSDVDTLHQLVRDLAAQVAGDRSELAQAQAEIDRLKLIIRRFQRAQFGRRSERIDGDQLALGLEDLDADIARLQARHPAASAHDAGSQATSRRQGLPEHLPREDIAIDITAVSSSIIIRSSARSDPSRLGARTICSPAPMVALSDGPPVAPSSRRQSSMTWSPSRISGTSCSA